MILMKQAQANIRYFVKCSFLIFSPGFLIPITHLRDSSSHTVV